jgi:GNAT superfamily N-acetyltransferase
MVEVRKAIPGDISVIVDFQKRMALETENLQLDNSIVENGVRAVFEDPNKGFYIVAHQDNRVVASLMLTPEWSDWRNRYFLWIQSLFVVPAFRNNGVFKKMYSYVKELVKTSDDFYGIRLYVEVGNTLAQEVYSKVGMNPDHYKMFEWTA